MDEVRETAGRRKYFAFVEAKVNAIDGEPATRTSYVLDCVELDAYRRDRGQDAESLALVRILSTPQRLSDLFELPRMPVEGDWLEVELGEGGNLPLAWVLSADNDYLGPAKRLRLHKMRFLRSEAEPTLTALTDDLAPETREELVAQFVLAAAPGDGHERAHFEALFTSIMAKAGLHARVLDVGQASAIVLCAQRRPAADVLGFFDVGWPLWFHLPSLPKATPVKLPANGGFVFLSHWDFDHFAMALSYRPELRNLRWYAPRQNVGPNTARFAASLGDRLTFLEDDSYGLANLQLVKGLGAAHGLGDDRNATGYVLRFEGEDGPKLLTGDVSYEHIPEATKTGLVGVAIPHHAGSGGGSPPVPAGNDPVAVASYGLPNRYRHPSQPFLNAHTAAGWHIDHTAKTSLSPRADRWV